MFKSRDATVKPLPHGQGSPDTEVEVLARSEERQCSEWAGQGYHCVPYYNCDECDSIIVDGTSLFDPRRAEENCATSENTFDCVLLVLKL